MSGIIFDPIIRKARKEHTCDMCYAPIAVGETYRSQAQICDGRFGSFKECLACQDACQWLHRVAPSDYPDGITYGAIEEELEYQLAEGFGVQDWTPLMIKRWPAITTTKQGIPE